MGSDPANSSSCPRCGRYVGAHVGEGGADPRADETGTIRGVLCCTCELGEENKRMRTALEGLLRAAHHLALATPDRVLRRELEHAVQIGKEILKPPLVKTRLHGLRGDA